MTPERQLFEALKRLAEDRKVELDMGPIANLIVPLVGGNQLELPMLFLITGPGEKGPL